MCRFLSAIYIRRSEGVYDLLSAPEKTDSHTELETLFQLRKEEAYVKVEFTPPTAGGWGDLDKWDFVLDERRGQDWFDADPQRARQGGASMRWAFIHWAVQSPPEIALKPC